MGCGASTQPNGAEEPGSSANLASYSPDHTKQPETSSHGSTSDLSPDDLEAQFQAGMVPAEPAAASATQARARRKKTSLIISQTKVEPDFIRNESGGNVEMLLAYKKLKAPTLPLCKAPLSRDGAGGCR